MEKKISKMQALMTAVGIMIGVGIYFKADNIMKAVGGNFGTAMIIWLIIAFGFIFSGLAAAAIAEHANPEGGIVGYIETFFGKKAAFIVGWFEFSVYVPILVSTLATVVVSYFVKLIGVDISHFWQMIMAIALVVLATGWNYLSTKLATLISVSATYLKIIPLIIICILGFCFGNPSGLTFQTATNEAFGVMSFLAPFIAIAFMFDGWINIGSMAVDMKNPKKDLPFVYVASLVLVCAIYMLYFVGVNLLMDSQQLISLGDDYLYKIASQFFGDWGARLVLVFVVVSGIGTMNAMFMSGNRYIEKLADDNLMFCSNFFRTRTKQDTPFNASLLTLALSCVGILLIFLQNIEFSIGGVKIFNGILLEDAAVAINSFILGVAFIINFKLFRQHKLGVFKGIIAPAVSMILVLIIVASYILTSENIFTSIISLVVIGLIILLGIYINRDELKNK